MKLCSFFGHRDTQVDIQPILRDIVINLIEKENVTLFYVGLEGNIDSIALQTLEELAKTYTQIKYYVVLAYMPKSKNKDLIFE